MGMIRVMPPPRPAIVVLAALLALTACSSDGSEDNSGEPTPTTPALESPAELEAAWTADLGDGDLALPHDTFTYRPRGDLDTWSYDGRLIVVTPRRVVALDADTGEVVWRFRTPARLSRICAATEDVNRHGAGGLLFAKAPLDSSLAEDESCTVAGVLDTRTGKLAWSKQLPAYDQPTSGRDDNHLAIGEKTLSVVSGCDDLRRLDARTGARLEEFLPANEGCYADIAFGPGIVVVTPDHTDENRVDVYDQDSGAKVETYPMPVDTRVYDVLSTTPLILDVEEDNHRVVRVFRDGKPRRHLGLTSNDNFPRLFIADQTLLASYGRRTIGLLGPGFGAYAMTGDELWQSGSTTPRPLGVAGDRVLTQAQILDPEQSDTIQFWLGRVDPQSGDQESYGRVDLHNGTQTRLGWNDDLFLILSGSTLQAFDLSHDDLPPMPEVPDQSPASPDTTDLAATDLTANDVEEVCREVSDTSLARLGIGAWPYPPPSECHWSDFGDDYDRFVWVDAAASVPTDESSAAEAAHSAAIQLRDSDGAPAMRPVDDLGDEAWLGLRPARYGAAGVDSILIVRQGNVVIRVRADQVPVHAGSAKKRHAATIARMRPAAEDLLDAMPER